jgi:MFS family permease
VLSVVYLALPSHVFSVPLPTPAEATFLAGGSGWLASSAALGLVAVAALAGAAVLENFAQRRGRRLVAVGGLVLVLLDACPSTALFPNLPASGAGGALRESHAGPHGAGLLASLYQDDPRARLARAQVEALYGLSPAAARAFVRPLPATDRLEPGDLGFPRLAVAVVDFSAYNLYRDAPFTGFIYVPNDLTGVLTAPEQVANPEIDRTLIKSVYGSDFAYVYER